jgi:aminoglycoside 6'-N-acetyltransferase I
MEETYSIKPLGVSDLVLIRDIFVGVFTNEPWNDDWSDEDQLRAYLLDIIDNKNSLSIGLVRNDEVIGISLGSIIHWYTGTEYYIREFCVKRACQRRGNGTVFMGLMEKCLIQNRINSIILSMDLDTPACRFYAKNNFGELPRSRFFHKSL